MTIEVTRDDIKHGRRCDPDCCPIGRALSRAGVDHLGVVGATVLVADRRTGAKRFTLPGDVKDWIIAFDGARPVEPISFELPLAVIKTERASTPKGAHTRAELIAA